MSLEAAEAALQSQTSWQAVEGKTRRSHEAPGLHWQLCWQLPIKRMLRYWCWYMLTIWSLLWQKLGGWSGSRGSLGKHLRFQIWVNWNTSLKSEFSMTVQAKQSDWTNPLISKSCSHSTMWTIPCQLPCQQSSKNGPPSLIALPLMLTAIIQWLCCWPQLPRMPWRHPLCHTDLPGHPICN